ncbi:hypothetical protein ACS0TY_029418 [Phlomoides rotata]
MGFFSRFIFLLILLSFDPFPVLSSPKANSPDSDLIRRTCKKTKYYDLCVSSLKSADSFTSNTKGLAVIMVKVGIANATATYSYLSSQMSVANDTLLKKVMKECGDKYSFANVSLQTSLVDLNGESYDYAYMHVMAASDYPNACHNAFNSYPQLVYPTPLAIREDALKRICDVVLSIVDALASSLTH